MNPNDIQELKAPPQPAPTVADKECLAAIVTKVIASKNLDDSAVRLHVFDPGGGWLDTDCLYSAEKHETTWHWPERV